MSRNAVERCRHVLLVLAVATAIAPATATIAQADLVIGPAIPVPGLSPNPNPGDEDFGWVSADGHSMLVATGHFPDRRIARRTWDAPAGAWTAPVEIGIGPEACGPWPSPDGNTMYYYAGSVAHIYRSQWSGTNWSVGELVPNVNTQYGGACPVFNGQQLFTGTTFDGNWGNFDIAVSDYNPATDEFTASLPVAELNSPYDDILNWISPDRSLVIFSSARPGGYGDRDLYTATWNSQLEQWSQITNLGPEVNTAANEFGGRIAPEAGLLFFQRWALDYSELTFMQAPVVPEPAALTLVAVGGFWLLARQRQRGGF